MKHSKDEVMPEMEAAEPDAISEDEIRECVIRLMETDGSISSGWKYRELREHEHEFTDIVRGLLNREYRNDE